MFAFEGRRVGKPASYGFYSVATVLALTALALKPITVQIPQIGSFLTGVFEDPLAWFILFIAVFFVARPLWQRPQVDGPPKLGFGGAPAIPDRHVDPETEKPLTGADRERFSIALQELHDFAAVEAVGLSDRIRVANGDREQILRLLETPNIAQPLVERIGRLQFNHAYFIELAKLDLSHLRDALLNLSHALDLAYKAKDWQEEAWEEKSTQLKGAGEQVFSKANKTVNWISAARAKI